MTTTMGMATSTTMSTAEVTTEMSMATTTTMEDLQLLQQLPLVDKRPNDAVLGVVIYPSFCRFSSIQLSIAQT